MAISHPKLCGLSGKIRICIAGPRGTQILLQDPISRKNRELSNFLFRSNLTRKEIITMDRKRIAIFLLALLLCGSWALAQSSHWLHIQVEEAGAKGEQVKVNVPLGLVETVLPMVEEKELTNGKIRLGDLPLTVAQMREIWQSLKAEGDFELASIKEAEMNLRIFKEGDSLYVRSTEDSKQEISVTVPAAVVDALLSGEDDELNIMAAAKALAQTGEGELVSIRDGDETVRVWVDTSGGSQ
jgi:hypothetical protein